MSNQENRILFPNFVLQREQWQEEKSSSFNECNRNFKKLESQELITSFNRKELSYVLTLIIMIKVQRLVL